MKPIIFIAVLIFFFLQPILGQDKIDSVKTYKNTVRINISNPMLFGEKNYIIGYERVFKNNQSITANVGRISFPGITQVEDSTFSPDLESKDKGFGFAIDYRFYLLKENKYKAPRGVYVGPYYSYNYFTRENTWTLNTADYSGKLKTDMRLNANLVGVQLGYQFVFWNRLAVDLVMMGPGWWFYNINATLSTDLSPADETLLFDKINDFIDEKLPGNDLIINPGIIDKKGSNSTSSSGFRYIVHIGFRF
jgi:hypothetical protein